MKEYVDISSLEIGLEKGEVDPIIYKDIELAFKGELTVYNDITSGDNFNAIFGGNIFICEFEEDLKQIEGCDFKWADTHDGKWPNITDTLIAWDAGGYVHEASSGWAFVFMANSNAGGPSFYIPARLWEAARMGEQITFNHDIDDRMMAEIVSDREREDIQDANSERVLDEPAD
jgi:hypothetical protein